MLTACVPSTHAGKHCFNYLVSTKVPLLGLFFARNEAPGSPEVTIVLKGIALRRGRKRHMHLSRGDPLLGITNPAHHSTLGHRRPLRRIQLKL